MFIKIKIFWLKIFLFATGDNNTGVNDTSGAPKTVNPQIYKKIWNGPNGILWDWGESDSWKKPEVENLVTLSL